MAFTKKTRPGTSLDAWDDTLGAFRAADRRAASLARRVIANEEFLRLLYSRGGFTSNVVDIPAEEMTRRGFLVADDTDGLIMQAFQRTGILAARQNALRWASLFGGGLGVMMANDGTSQIWRPLRENSIQSMEGLRVFDRFRVSWSPSDLYTDKGNPKFGLPEVYTISPIFNVTGGSFRVHETRCVILDGEPCPDASRLENNGWGDSLVMRVLNELVELRKAFESTGDIFDTFVTKVFGIPGLMKMVMEGLNSEILGRVDLMKATLRESGAILLDSGTGGETAETFEKSASSVTGLADIIDRYQGALSGVTRIPQTLLFGRSPAGMNATGEGDDNNWCNHVEALQQNRLLPFDQRLVYVTMLAKQGPTGGKILKNWTITYPSLKQVPPKAQAEIALSNARTAVELIRAKVIHPDEARAALASVPFITLDETKYGKIESRPGMASGTGADPEKEPGEEVGGEPSVPAGGKKTNPEDE